MDTNQRLMAERVLALAYLMKCDVAVANLKYALGLADRAEQVDVNTRAADAAEIRGCVTVAIAALSIWNDARRTARSE